MPIHDWSRVPAGIFHDFHQDLIIQIRRDLNAGVLPPGYYAMAEPVAGGLGPDVLGLHKPQVVANDAGDGGVRSASGGGGGTLLAPPKVRIIAEADQEYVGRKRSLVAIRHMSGHRVVAVVEVVSPGNKLTRPALDQFIRKAGEFLDQGIALLVVDLIPPGDSIPTASTGRSGSTSPPRSSHRRSTSP